MSYLREVPKIAQLVFQSIYHKQEFTYSEGNPFSITYVDRVRSTIRIFLQNSPNYEQNAAWLGNLMPPSVYDVSGQVEEDLESGR